MKKLTEATCYEDIEKYIKNKSWDSKTIASRIVWYAKSCGVYGTVPNESTQVVHKQVYDWLCQYRDDQITPVGFTHKDKAVLLLQEGSTVSEVFKYFKDKDLYVSKVTLYNYVKNYVKAW